jgi:hypothetical protein
MDIVIAYQIAIILFAILGYILGRTHVRKLDTLSSDKSTAVFGYADALRYFEKGEEIGRIKERDKWQAEVERIGGQKWQEGFDAARATQSDEEYQRGQEAWQRCFDAARRYNAYDDK